MTLVADQSEIVSFLTRILTVGDAPPRVVSTHASLVFLTRERAFKLKRAVRFAFLDFSTPQRRLALCARELELNRRWAPDLYLALRRVTREADGRLALDGDGALVDALVEMRRFADADLLETRLTAGDVSPALMTGLARRLAALHVQAPARRDHGGASALARVLALNEAALRATDAFAAAEIEALTAALAAALARLAPLLDARRDAGKTRRCHADLILRNICVLDGEAIPFDALEFDEDLGAIDVLYDLAFLLMDLWRAGRPDLANLVFNRYLDAADETDGLALLPFFVAVRATVRAHIAAAQAQDVAAAQAPAAGDDPDAARALARQARVYFDLARACLAAAPARLVAIGGLSGSGKSTLAAALAPDLGAIPGARVLSSDRLRKAMHGVLAETRLPPEAYQPDVSRAVYARQRDDAARALAAGCAVVADAVFDRPDARVAIEGVARAARARFDGLWLDAPLAALGERVEARRHDPSDATRAVLEAQAEGDPGPIAWTRLDAAAPRERLRERARRVLTPD